VGVCDERPERLRTRAQVVLPTVVKLSLCHALSSPSYIRCGPFFFVNTFEATALARPGGAYSFHAGTECQQIFCRASLYVRAERCGFRGKKVGDTVAVI